MTRSLNLYDLQLAEKNRMTYLNEKVWHPNPAKVKQKAATAESNILFILILPTPFAPLPQFMLKLGRKYK